MFDIALAYIDPGSGSLIIQGLIASIVAITFFFRQQIARVFHLVRRQEEVEPVADDHVDAG